MRLRWAVARAIQWGFVFTENVLSGVAYRVNAFSCGLGWRIAGERVRRAYHDKWLDRIVDKEDEE